MLPPGQGSLYLRNHRWPLEMRYSGQVGVEMDDYGGGDGENGNADDGDDGANGAPGFDQGAVGSLEQMTKPKVVRFQDPFSLGWYYRSCSASEEFGSSFYDVL